MSFAFSFIPEFAESKFIKNSKCLFCKLCGKTNGIIKVLPKMFYLNVHFTGFNLSTDAKVKTMIRDSLVYYENEGI